MLLLGRLAVLLLAVAGLSPSLSALLLTVMFRHWACGPGVIELLCLDKEERFPVYWPSLIGFMSKRLNGLEKALSTAKLGP